MPPRGWELVFLDDTHLPIAVLHILFEKRPERSARAIRTPDFRALPDLAAATDDAQVMLIILVTDQFLVKVPEPLECFFAPAAQIDSIHRSQTRQLMAGRAAGRER